MTKILSALVNGTEQIPAYMQKAKTFFLSKDADGSEFPQIGKVRIIAVLPAITKLLEQVVLILTKEELKKKAPLHPN